MFSVPPFSLPAAKPSYLREVGVVVVLAVGGGGSSLSEHSIVDYLLYSISAL